MLVAWPYNIGFLAHALLEQGDADEAARVIDHGNGGLVIGDDCGFGPYMVIHTANHRSEQVTVPIRDQGWEPGPVEMGADCFIGMGTCIVPGVRIGEGTIVGAGSVVAKDLPS